MIAREVRYQYQTTELLRTRIETHERHSEWQYDLSAECAAALRLAGDEPLLDVGCGPGDWPRYLRVHSHRGPLAGLDQSAAMIAAATEASAGLDIAWHIGAANALPFADGAFTVITARHMLYHVPDIPGALREFARVVGPGGIVFATTNSREDMPRIQTLKADMLAQFGVPLSPPASATFCIENACDILGAVYPDVEETTLPNAFVFTAPEPIVAYLMTTIATQQAADDPRTLAAIHDWLMAEAARRLTALGGIWRDPKDVGLYRCRVG